MNLSFCTCIRLSVCRTLAVWGSLFEIKSKANWNPVANPVEKKDSPFKIISWKPKNLLNSLESEEMWGHKFTTRRIYSQIRGCVREAALGHLGILNLAQNSEFWDN